ncbi:hypothetical protein BSKO_12562 [Bryopsis sp. KO-2023]|nr:hypothetical protein BSKO_12562 [Bryopsis sp. KO-2023]
MWSFTRRVLGLIAVATAVGDVLACSDIKVFLGSCTLKEFGRKITKEAALDLESEFLKRDGFLEVVARAVEYFDFDREAFDGVCEIPHLQACGLLNCGCEQEAYEFPLLASTGRRLLLCFPVFGCKKDTSGEGTVDTGEPKEPLPRPDETIVGICVGSKCKGFLMRDYDLVNARAAFVCNELLDRACSVRVPEPVCEDDFVAECCVRPSRNSCFCRSCRIRQLWRKQTSDFGDDFFRGRAGSACRCPQG